MNSSSSLLLDSKLKMLSAYLDTIKQQHIEHIEIFERRKNEQETLLVVEILYRLKEKKK